MALEDLVQQKEYTGAGYAPVIDYGAWRVAVLNHHPELNPENICALHCHDQTDEVFVLLRGHCLLYIGETDPARPEHTVAIHCIDMQPGRIYNVRRGVWHSHTPSVDASVLLVENRDTDSTNTRERTLTAEQRGTIVDFSGVRRTRP